MRYYPVYLDLQGRPCVVIGGGRLAEEKVRGLLAAGAAVTVIATDVDTEIREAVGTGRITWIPRVYQRGDLAGAALAFVAGQDPETVAAVWREGKERGTLINTVDDVPHCGFIAPSIVRRGDLTVAISTSGKAPALAVRLRQRLEGMLGDEHARFLEMAGTIRQPLAERHPDFATRRELWYRLVDSDVLDLLRSGDETSARARFEEILGVLPA
ncbi:MAG TPA: bifunctional precorrin-2 dehydrogenase/sirohydrochlorin ferrochelatase [Thermoanaerobaculia bacterium]|nr:bifunctional precorrin-2 dehydrogenase/sirohydrochlorin ferrochelatase [Thermoanaerobaculia bacterium]